MPYEKCKNSRKTALTPYEKRKNSRKTALQPLGNGENAENYISNPLETEKHLAACSPTPWKQKDGCLNRIHGFTLSLYSLTTRPCIPFRDDSKHNRG